MAKYGKKAQDKVERAMHERKKGTLKSGRSSRKVTSRAQAIAIGLSEARQEGAKVPKKKGAKKTARKKTATKRTATKRTGRKKAAKKTARKKSSR
jgi:topoisomerase IA-like protein